MAEEYTLTTPETKPSNPKYQVRKLDLYYEPPNKSWYTALFLGGDGVSFVTYNVVDREAGAYGPGTVVNLATARIKQLNTMNFTTQSMQRRFLNFASTDINPATGQPFLPSGTVTGTPDV